MASLLDIAAVTEKVTVRGVRIEVYGISAEGVACLLGRFGELRALFVGREIDLDAETLVRLGPEIVAAVIAAGCGAPGDDKHEETAARLPVGDQLELLAAIIRLTLPQGPRPFVEKLMALAGAAGVDLSASDRGTKSRKPSKS